jgi:hypothetical protein
MSVSTRRRFLGQSILAAAGLCASVWSFRMIFTRARELGLMPKEELLLWAPRATGTPPPASPRKGLRVDDVMLARVPNEQGHGRQIVRGC